MEFPERFCRNCKRALAVCTCLMIGPEAENMSKHFKDKPCHSTPVKEAKTILSIQHPNEDAPDTAAQDRYQNSTTASTTTTPRPDSQNVYRLVNGEWVLPPDKS